MRNGKWQYFNSENLFSQWPSIILIKVTYVVKLDIKDTLLKVIWSIKSNGQFRWKINMSFTFKNMCYITKSACFMGKIEAPSKKFPIRSQYSNEKTMQYVTILIVPWAPKLKEHFHLWNDNWRPGIVVGSKDSSSSNLYNLWFYYHWMQIDCMFTLLVVSLFSWEFLSQKFFRER